MYKIGKEVIKQESDDYIYFTGTNSEFLILTKEEVESYENGVEVEMVEVSKEAYDKYVKFAYGFAGKGKIKENKQEFLHIKEEIILEKEYKDSFLLDKDKILLLDENNNLVLYQNEKEEILFSIDKQLDFEKGIEWHVNKDKNYISICEKEGQKAILVNIVEKKIDLNIDRGDYHTKQTDFPILFFLYKEIEYFAYGASWDRIKVIELESKKLINKNEDLDETIGSFWGRIIKHENYIIADNWEWNPIGVIYACDLEFFFENGYWRDKDYTVIENAHYFWNRNITSYGGKIYITCIGRDDEELLEGLMIYTGEKLDKLDFIFGPKNILAMDNGFLYSQVDKFEIWHIENKELLFRSDKLDLGKYSHIIGGFLRVEGKKIEISKFISKSI